MAELRDEIWAALKPILIESAQAVRTKTDADLAMVVASWKELTATRADCGDPSCKDPHDEMVDYARLVGAVEKYPSSQLAQLLVSAVVRLAAMDAAVDTGKGQD